MEPTITKYLVQREKEFVRLKETGRTEFAFSPFVELKLKSNIFMEAVFCLLTANFKAENSLYMQKDLGELLGEELSEFKNNGQKHKLDITTLKNTIAKILKKYKHRFVNQRTERILMLIQNWEKISRIIAEAKEVTLNDGTASPELLTIRNKLAKLINGYGLKEASHFLRNIGYLNIAIIDRHILRYLTTNGYLPDYKNLTPKVYKHTEQVFCELAQKHKMPCGIYDLYIFYKQTGKILK